MSQKRDSLLFFEIVKRKVIGGVMARLFVATLITEVKFVSQEASDKVDENYRQHLTEELTKAAQRLSLRTVQSHKVRHCAVESVDRK